MPKEELGYRKGPVPANNLELFWLPAHRRWNEPIASAAIELLTNPRQSISAPISVIWGDGSSDEVPCPPFRSAPRMLQVYAHRAHVKIWAEQMLVKPRVFPTPILRLKRLPTHPPFKNSKP